MRQQGGEKRGEKGEKKGEKREEKGEKNREKMEEKMKKREKKERKKEKKRELKRENKLLHLRLQTLQLEMANSDKNLDEQVDVNSCCNSNTATQHKQQQHKHLPIQKELANSNSPNPSAITQAHVNGFSMPVSTGGLIAPLLLVLDTNICLTACMGATGAGWLNCRLGLWLGQIVRHRPDVQILVPEAVVRELDRFKSGPDTKVDRNCGGRRGSKEYSKNRGTPNEDRVCGRSRAARAANRLLADASQVDSDDSGDIYVRCFCWTKPKLRLIARW